MPADQVAQMFLGQFVVRQVQRFKTVAAEVARQLPDSPFAMGGEAHEDMGVCSVADAVVELGHVARAARQVANHLAKAAETPALLGDGDGQQRFALLAHLGALGHEAQAVEIHVGAAQDGGVGLARVLCVATYCLMAATASAPCGLDDAAGVHEHILIAAHTASVSTVI